VSINVSYRITIEFVITKDEIIMVTQKGVVIRSAVKGVRSIGRNTQGVCLIKLGAGDEVIDVARIITEESEKEKLVSAPEGEADDASVVESVETEEELVEPESEEETAEEPQPVKKKKTVSVSKKPAKPEKKEKPAAKNKKRETKKKPKGKKK